MLNVTIVIVNTMAGNLTCFILMKVCSIILQQSMSLLASMLRLIAKSVILRKILLMMNLKKGRGLISAWKQSVCPVIVIIIRSNYLMNAVTAIIQMHSNRQLDLIMEQQITN